MAEDDPQDYAPEQAPTVLLLVDVLNALEFEDGEALLAPALAMADAIDGLRAACGRSGIPTIYANDNFGRWQSDLEALVEGYLEDGVRGAPLIERLRPRRDDYNVLKPENSAFYATPLGLLLRRLGAKNLILAGLTTDRCIAFTANDAWMRQYRVLVPRDCCAALREEYHRASLEILERVVRADTRPWAHLDLRALAEDRAERS